MAYYTKKRGRPITRSAAMAFFSTFALKIEAYNGRSGSERRIFQEVRRLSDDFGHRRVKMDLRYAADTARERLGRLGEYVVVDIREVDSAFKRGAVLKNKTPHDVDARTRDAEAAKVAASVERKLGKGSHFAVRDRELKELLGANVDESAIARNAED